MNKHCHDSFHEFNYAASAVHEYKFEHTSGYICAQPETVLNLNETWVDFKVCYNFFKYGIIFSSRELNYNISKDIRLIARLCAILCKVHIYHR